MLINLGYLGLASSKGGRSVLPYMRNFDAGTGSNLAAFRAAKALASDAVVYIVGSSSAVGGGAGTASGGLTDARKNSWPKRLADLLPLAAEDVAFLGDSTNDLLAYGSYDPRVVIGSGWVRTSTGVAGAYWQNTTTTGSLDFAPGYPIDRVDVHTLNAATGSLDVAINGGATIQNVALTGAFTVTKTTVNLGTAGLHTINLRRVSGECRVVGMVAWCNGVPMLRIVNAGLYGSNSAYGADNSNPWRPLQFMKAQAPKLVLDHIGLNDAISAVAIATFKANKQAIWDAARLSGDVIAMTLQPVSAATLSAATLATYNEAIIELADLNDVPVFDLNAWVGDYAAANARGEYYDGLHSTALGYYLNFAVPAQKFLMAA